MTRIAATSSQRNWDFLPHSWCSDPLDYDNDISKAASKKWRLYTKSRAVDAWLVRYRAPRTAHLYVRVLYQSDGEEILACVSSPMVFASAERLVRSLAGSFAVGYELWSLSGTCLRSVCSSDPYDWELSMTSRTPPRAPDYRLVQLPSQTCECGRTNCTLMGTSHTHKIRHA